MDYSKTLCVSFKGGGFLNYEFEDHAKAYAIWNEIWEAMRDNTHAIRWYRPYPVCLDIDDVVEAHLE